MATRDPQDVEWEIHRLPLVGGISESEKRPCDYRVDLAPRGTKDLSLLADERRVDGQIGVISDQLDSIDKRSRRGVRGIYVFDVGKGSSTYITTL
jgi:hypothetical protein